MYSFSNTFEKTVLSPLLKISWPYMHVLISGPSILFHIGLYVYLHDSSILFGLV